MNNFKCTGYAVAAALCAAVHAAEPVLPLHVDASLITDRAKPGGDTGLWVGLKMRHLPEWHTYWKNPGDAGMPTRIAWTLPPGWSASGIAWPAPRRLQIGQLASYGYADEAVLPVKLTPPAGWDGKASVRIAARANWLACKEQCIPESADVALVIPAQSNVADQNLLAVWRERVPQAYRFASAGVEKRDGRLQITLEPAGAGQFFPEQEELVEPGDPPKVAVAGKRVTWSAKLGLQGKALSAPAAISGVWVPESGKPVFLTLKLK